MTSYLWAGLYILGGLALMALGDLVSEEIRGWLDLVPQGILRLAAGRLTDVGKVTIYEDEWLPELTYILRGAESRPITRVIIGTKFALGILASANRIRRHLDLIPVRAAPEIWNMISALLILPGTRFEPAPINAKVWRSMDRKFSQGAGIEIRVSHEGPYSHIVFQETGLVLGVLWDKGLDILPYSPKAPESESRPVL
jgi:hypothetical protein